MDQVHRQQGDNRNQIIEQPRAAHEPGESTPQQVDDRRESQQGVAGTPESPGKSEDSQFQIDSQIARPLTGRPGQVTTTEQVEVYVPDRLTRSGVAVIDNPKPVFSNSEIVGNLAGNLKNVTDELVIDRGQVKGSTDMFARDEQQMTWRLRIDVLNDHEMFILINEFGRDIPSCDFTKDAIVRHALFPPLQMEPAATAGQGQQFASVPDVRV